MNLLELYINSLPIEVAMQFGINSNVKLNHVDISDRLTRKGDVSIKTFFMEFIKIDADGDPIQREEFSFFKLNAEKLEFAEMNFNDQFNKLFHLGLLLFGEDEKVFEAKMDDVNAKVFKDTKFTSILNMADSVFVFNSKTAGKKKPKLKDLAKLVENLNKKLNEFYFELYEGKWGINNSPLMEIISTVDKKGYKNLPDEADFVALGSGTLVLDPKYLRRKEASEKPEVADEVGDEVSEDDLEDLEIEIEMTDEVIEDIEDDVDDVDEFESLDDVEED